MTATIYAFCKQKGGSGKPTVTFHIADTARRARLKVLAVDMDPQRSLSTILTKEPIHPGDAGIYDASAIDPRPPSATSSAKGSGPASNSPPPSPPPRPSPQSATSLSSPERAASAASATPSMPFAAATTRHSRSAASS